MSIRYARGSVVTAAFLLTAFPAGGAPPLATGRDASVSEDGLHLVDPDVMEGAWVRPDLDLSQYSKVYFYGTGIGFRDVSGPEVRATSRPFSPVGATITSKPSDSRA